MLTEVMAHFGEVFWAEASVQRASRLIKELRQAGYYETAAQKQMFQELARCGFFWSVNRSNRSYRLWEDHYTKAIVCGFSSRKQDLCLARHSRLIKTALLLQR